MRTRIYALYSILDVHYSCNAECIGRGLLDLATSAVACHSKDDTMERKVDEEKIYG
jgi:hypothetical protein